MRMISGILRPTEIGYDRIALIVFSSVLSIKNTERMVWLSFEQPVSSVLILEISWSILPKMNFSVLAFSFSISSTHVTYILYILAISPFSLSAIIGN